MEKEESTDRPHVPQYAVLVLQHPQEAKKNLGTARILSQSLVNCRLRTGLSWPNLQRAWGSPTHSRDWVVLYVGGRREGGELGSEEPSFKEVKGMVLLDGNWKQSKTLWWRNPWLLKLRRLVMNPSAPSQYTRRQPRKNCFSTMEAAVCAFERLGDDETARFLHTKFQNFMTSVGDNLLEPH
ncbi:MAG: DTW domain-containing protein [Deltaproteobacteria bacterium]|nr:DTW domain-containing protein [Deltaproteobacteria bacterium]